MNYPAPLIHVRRAARSMTVPGPGPNVPRVGRKIPYPDVAIHPILSLSAFTTSGGSAPRSILAAGRAVHVQSGRDAIGLALDLTGTGAGAKVLVPAYHCASVIAPVVAFDAVPVFYKVTRELSPDMSDLSSKIDADTRAVLAIHYFGFQQDFSALRALCDQNGLYLIEDCAHCFFGESNGMPVGATGDYAIASLRKFFPVSMGGSLVSGRRDLDSIRLRPAGGVQNLRSLKTLMDEANYYGRLRLFGPATEVASGIYRKLVTSRSVERQAGNPSSGSMFEDSGTASDFVFSRERMDLEISALDRAIAGLVSTRRIAEARRRSYRTLLSGLSDIPGCRPLYDTLHPHTVPYLFPVIVDDLESVFPRLEDAAVPMQRFGQFLWPGVDESVCRVSAAYSHDLLQFPCHQDMRAGELSWVIDTVRSVFKARAVARTKGCHRTT